jgi:threonine dehydrogenase-like Zn-dependent dehydrogenase
MRAAVVVEPGRVEVLTVPEPQPGPYQCLVETLAGGVCGTDRHIVDGTFYRSAYPAILGHESLGRVLSVGPAVRNLAPGDMVLRTTAVRPGEQLGAFNSMLGSFAEFGLATDIGAMDEDGLSAEVVAYDRLQRRVASEFDPIDTGAFIVLKETMSWLRRIADVEGKRVLVIGTGAAGLSFARVARLGAARQVMVLGRRPESLAQAVALGADDAFSASPDQLQQKVRELTDGAGADLVIDAAGATEVLEASPDCLARGGILAVYALSAGQSGTFKWGWDRAVPRTWSLRFGEPDEAGIHDEAWELVASGRYDLKATLTDVVQFEDAAGVIDVMAQPASIKVAIAFTSERTDR